MSNVIFPALAALNWDIVRRPIWATHVQTAASGREQRSSYWTYPVYEWTLSYDVLYADAGTAQDFQTLLGFFNARQGSYDSFLYRDPDDSAVVSQLFATGDGVTTQFQLERSLGGFVEPIKDLAAAPTVRIGGIVQGSGYSVSSTGVVTFTTAPAQGAPLTWSGSFYFRVRFASDAQDFTNFARALWATKSLKLRGVK